MTLFRTRTVTATERRKTDIRQQSDLTAIEKPNAKRDVAYLYQNPTIWL